MQPQSGPPQARRGSRTSAAAALDRLPDLSRRVDAAARTSRWNNVDHVYGTEVAAYGIGNCKADLYYL
jgi:hypothetical protein